MASNGDFREVPWAVSLVLRSSNAGLALMAVAPTTTIANGLQETRNLVISSYEVPPKHPLCMGILGN